MSQLTTNTTTIESLITAINELPEPETVELQEKTISPTTSSQIVSPDDGYGGLSKVTVNAMPTATQATPTITVSSAGLITASSTQTTGYVAAGTKSATKQLSTQAAQTITPGTSDKTIASEKYLTGTQTIKGDANLIPANIAEGVSIFGVEGTMKASSGGFPNGTEWTKSNVSSRSISSIYYTNGLWVIGCNSNGGLYYSTDGKTWTKSNNGTTIYEVYGAANMWIARGNSYIYYSTDGKTWTQTSASVQSSTPWGISYARGIWVVGGWYSTDGITWTKSSSVSYASNMKGTAYCGGMFLGVGAGNKSGVYYSTDGKIWTQGTIEDTSLLSKSTGLGKFVYENGLFVASFHSLGLHHSTDGMVWSVSNIASGDFQSIHYNGELWVAGHCAEGGCLYYSTDGKIWTKIEPGPEYISAIDYASGNWVATASNGVWCSTDGKIWTQKLPWSAGAPVTGILHANNTWVVPGSSSNSTASRPYYSVTWEPT